MSIITSTVSLEMKWAIFFAVWAVVYSLATTSYVHSFFSPMTTSSSMEYLLKSSVTTQTCLETFSQENLMMYSLLSIQQKSSILMFSYFFVSFNFNPEHNVFETVVADWWQIDSKLRVLTLNTQHLTISLSVAVDFICQLLNLLIF